MGKGRPFSSDRIKCFPAERNPLARRKCKRCFRLSTLLSDGRCVYCVQILRKIAVAKKLENLKGSDQNQATRDSAINLSSELTTISKPSRLASQEKRLASSLGPCSARLERIRLDLLKGSDQSEFGIQQKTTTSMPRTLSSIAKQLRSSSKMRFLCKRKALEKKKKNLVMIKRKA